MVPGLVLATGVLVGVLLVLHYNSSALHRALGAVGGIGLGAAAAVNIAAVSLCAAAWRGLLADKAGLPAFLWFRFARNAAADLLGFIPAAGELVALREMTLHGIEGHLALGSLIADLTIQLIAQIAFTLVGVTLLLAIAPGGPLTWISLAGIGLLTGILTALIAVQRWGVGRILAAMARRILPKALRGNPETIVKLDARLRDIYAARRQIGVSTALHISAWFVGVTEAGLVLSLMEAWPGLKVVLIMESIVFGMRTTAFFIPGAWGVQEAAYVLVGPVFGLAPEVMLALTLVKRARELVVGVPVLVLGQILSAFRSRTPGWHPGAEHG
jgi:putative membrane protein